MEPILHGDVSLHPIEKLPEGLIKIDHHGESGNRHVIVADKVADLEVYQNPETALHFLFVKSPVEIQHEEHRTLIIEPGIYEEKKELEYNPFERQLQQVLD